MKKTKVWLFCVKVGFALLCSVLSACGSSPAPAQSPTPIQSPASIQASAPQVELDAAIRETTNYFNQQLPRGNKLVILNIQSEFPALSEYIIDELIANTVNDKVFTVVDRQQLNAIRAELVFQMSGEVDDATAQALGRMAGAQIIISGAVTRIGNLYRLRVRALNVQSAQIEGQFNKNIPDSPMITELVRSRANDYSSGKRGSSDPAPVDPNVYNGNGHKYEIINRTMSWTDAKRYCEERGGHLATIVDSGEQAFIENLLSREGDKRYYWLGGYCGSDRRFQWLTGEHFDYTNWMPGEPNNSENKEDKIEIMRMPHPIVSSSKLGQWNDAYTNANLVIDNVSYVSDLGFICEWE